ncbi:prefoldin subunit 5-like protein [Leptotrombidium deliense]|uniref:Prefoldin subunit 5-like protein n=1 Tax=Leptotrombidium deliense TaxID=299467 RepID=A0A443SQV1_9ACAR|nr:prefoldin subunit 5-like protein [Leptotrombidium deliense]
MTSEIAEVELLLAMKRRFDQEIEILSKDINSLQMEKKKCEEAKEIIELKKPTESILAPLTKSLFIETKIDKESPIVVDIGLGYSLEMDAKKASDFFVRKMMRISGNIEHKIRLVNEKANQRDCKLYKNFIFL